MLLAIRPTGNQPIANIDIKAGSVVDLSYKNRTISATSVPLGTGQFGESNGCREFTTNGSQITISDLASEIVTGYNAGNGFTIINNVKYHYVTGNMCYGQPGYNNCGFVVYKNSLNKQQLYLLRGSNNFIDTSCEFTITDDVWFQSAMVLKKGAYKFVINGTEYKGTDASDSLSTAGSNQLNIGNLGDGWNSNRDMRISDFKVYPKVLSINEINILKNEKGRIKK